MTMSTAIVASIGALGWWLLAARVAERSPLSVRTILWSLWLTARWSGRVIEHRRTGERMLATRVSRVNIASLDGVWRNRKSKRILRDLLVPWEIQIMAIEDRDWHAAQHCEMKVHAWKPIEPFWRRHLDPYRWCSRERTATPERS